MYSASFRVERDNASIKHELEEIKVVSDEVLRAKVFSCSWEMNVSVFVVEVFLLSMSKL